MADFIVPVDLAANRRIQHILVLDADNSWHAQVAAYMHVTRAQFVPDDVTDITDAIGNVGPMEINDRVSARVYNPDPYRDYPRQRGKQDGD